MAAWWKISFGAALLAAGAGLLAPEAFTFGHEQAAPRYRLAPLTRGPIMSTVRATGTLMAVVTVDVGTQVSGMVKTLLADFNSEVEADEVIARIDPAPFEASLVQAEAELGVARASVDIQVASLAELEAELAGFRAALAEAETDLERKRELFGRKVEASSSVDTARARFEQADSEVRAALARLAKQKAQIAVARAQVQQKEAAVRQRRLELDYTYIRSPVDGVVISRNVDAGQTVAASLQSPILFRIAQDLTELQVRISVDEADIGRVREGQTVYFAVDSYPGRYFEGRVAQIRKASQEISNVVTYTVIGTADNDDLSLLPGMTANVTIVVEARDDALKAPATAVRLHLPDEAAPTGAQGWVWTLDETGAPRAVPIEPGLSDGNETEIIGAGLVPGSEVIVGAAPPVEADQGDWLRLAF